MPDRLLFSTGTVFAFLMVLARVGGALIFVPLPGVKSAPEPVRGLLAIGFTLALFERWPAIDGSGVTLGTMACWAAAEAVVGVALGVCIAIVLEAFGLAAQILGLQAGYAYASTIDPNTEADSGILLVLAQLTAGMLFFALGLDREVLRLFAQSLEFIPPGQYVFGALSGQLMIRLASSLFAVGVRLALPVVALLVLVDVALALLGRLNAALQLVTVAFPAKMLTALAVLSWTAAMYPRVLAEFSNHAWATARQLMGR